MKPLRVLIVDDEHFAVHSLHLLLSHYPNLVILPSTGNGIKALEQLHNDNVDMVFIDVLMPGLNGIDVLKQLNKVSAISPPLFVIHTAYEQFAYSAFQYKAFAYLTKPLSPRQLQQVLLDAYAVLQRNTGQTLQQQHPKLQFHIGSSTVFIEEQEIIMNLADMLIETYVAESALLRVEKLITLRGEEACALEKDAALVYLHSAIDKLNSAGKVAITSFAEGDELRVMLMGLKRFTKYEVVNTKALRRQIAAKLIEENQYCF